MEDANKFGLSPVGTALWPYLNEPDKKWPTDGGVFTCKLKVTDIEQAEAFAKEIDARIAERFAQARATSPRPDDVRLADPPYHRCDDGSAIVFSFKMRALTKGKRGKKRHKVGIVNSVGKPTRVRIGHGSEIRLGFKCEQYHSGLVGVGVSLRPLSAQVIKLVDPTKPPDAAHFGFVNEAEVATGLTK